MAAHRDITVIGASAGGVAALQALLRGLPGDYPAAIFVVLHLAPESPSVLANILDRSSRLPVQFAVSGTRIRPSTVTVAPPDLHLYLQQDRVLLSRGPRENRHRPSVDVLFRSAAVSYGPRVTGVVLSGRLDDGAAGLWAIKRRGGVAVVQHPDDAESPDMPRAALQRVDADRVVPIDAMAATLAQIADEPVGAVAGASNDMAEEVRMATRNDSHIAELDSLGRRAELTCPECGGSLWEFVDGGPRFRCHVGHAYSLRTLAAEQESRVEAAIWAALRSMEERERLAQRMASEARARGHEPSAEAYEENAKAHAAHAETLRELLRESTGSEDGDEVAA